MLYLEPIEALDTIPEDIRQTIRALAQMEFGHPYKRDLELINLGRKIPLIEKDGTFLYEGVVVGYLRAMKPQQLTWPN